MFFRRPTPEPEPTPQIRFLCEPRDEQVIAPPVPAKKHMPDWFRKLPAIDPEQRSLHDTGLTVKRCMPFLDAMNTGWIIPLAASVRLEISQNGTQVVGAWDFDRTMMSNHGPHQVAGNPWGTDAGPRPPRKFHNYWTVVTPPGWSCLFIHPMNRPNGIFEIAAGIVDTDTYRAPIHFPFFATGPDGLYDLAKGTPIAQVIPFRRQDAGMDAFIGAESAPEAAARDAVTRNTRASSGWYRTDARAPR
ncbi:hypothetical protein [Paracoccus sp. (in: a-proteobacteria)]|uniref:hypothetical protein n=1 Tax=Paracoccus sp. TaxID=267 RepID=UPI0026E05713|nr:hypothetical protein [Paracoccus sp. (in: a-proteobacteria)]MDO5648552.1 hypothetical protein [Paracoccus sp. (in: a-proteobacteria)]